VDKKVMKLGYQISFVTYIMVLSDSSNPICNPLIQRFSCLVVFQFITLGKE